MQDNMTASLSLVHTMQLQILSGYLAFGFDVFFEGPRIQHYLGIKSWLQSGPSMRTTAHFPYLLFPASCQLIFYFSKRNDSFFILTVFLIPILPIPDLRESELLCSWSPHITCDNQDSFSIPILTSSSSSRFAELVYSDAHRGHAILSTCCG